jgi:hypothetical protein
LSRDFDKREKLAKEDFKIKEKIATLTAQETEQKKNLAGCTKQRKELKSFEEYVKSIDNAFEDQELADQIAKEKKAHATHIKS